MLRSKKALISVSNKTGIARFAGELISMGWSLTASPGTARALRGSGLAVTEMEKLTGIPSLLGHRVFSEHIKIAGALVAEPTESHDRDRERFDIPWFDLLCVDLYPLSDLIAKGKEEKEIIDSTDIGGITLIRNGVKGRRIVVTDPDDRALVVDSLKKAGDVDEAMRRELWAKAELLCARYCFDSAKYISGNKIDGFMGTRSMDLCYGENPYQSNVAFYNGDSNDGLALSHFKQRAGEKPSYVNLTSLDGLVGIISRLSAAFAMNTGGKTPFVAIGAKHGLPVGAAVDWEAPEPALKKMLWGDPKVIWGGEVITNFRISEGLAEMLLTDGRRKEVLGTGSWMLDLIVAPDFDQRGVALLGGRGKRRIFSNPALSAPTVWEGPVYRNVRGGFIKQPAPDYILRKDDVDWVGEPLTGLFFDTLLLAWAIAWSIQANGVALACNRQMVGCDGQPSSVGAVQAAIQKMNEGGHDGTGLIFAANAFLPFADSVQSLADQGCVGGVLPKGGKNEEEIRDLFARRAIRVAFVPESFRGFARH